MFEWLKKKPTGPEENPSAYKESERYQGKPLLVILKNYVLDCIGALSPEKQDGVRAIVQRVWSGDDDWKASVRHQLQLDETVDDTIRGMWNTNQNIAAEQGVELHAVQFAKMVVDQNFADLIE